MQLGYNVILAEDAIGDRDIPGTSGEDVTKVCSRRGHVCECEKSIC